MDYNTHRPAGSRLGRLCCAFPRGRRLALAITSRIANKKFVYGFVTTSLISSKLVHIHAHKEAIPQDLLHRWFYTFFGQEMLLLFIFRLLLDGWLYSKPRGWIRAFFGFISTLLITLTTSLSVIAVSFYAAAGAEVHWSNIGFAGDAAGRALLLSGIFVLLITLAVLLGVAWLAQNLIFVISSIAVDIVEFPFAYLRGRRNYDLLPSREHSKYADFDDDKAGADGEESDNRKQNFLMYFKVDKKSWGWIVWRVSYALFVLAVVAQIFMYYNRPLDGSLIFMSWTSVCLPFIDLKSSSPNLGAISPVYNVGIGRTWDYRSAIGDPIPLPWLPQDSVPMGFEDWYVDGKTRYSAANDPLRISNRDEDLLPQLLNIDLEGVKIRHVVFLLLESTRKDVFPVKKDGLIWNRFKKTFDKEEMPEEVIERLRTLTPTANWLTGDYADGFHLNETKKKGRGGINFNDAYTPASYTLKAITGSLCGVMPLQADFNIEHEHNLYQPCLPQIFEALNRVDEGDSDNFTSYKWDSSFMQSVTLDYDKFDRLMPALGFPQKNIIAKDYLKTDEAKFGKVDLPDINYFGMAEVCLEDYIRDAFVRAKKDNGRVFLTHITSTSHHPYVMPDDEKYVPLGNGLDDMSHYVNAVGYDDRWLQTVLDVLKEQEVDDETLVIALGDHGLSLPENDKPPCYYNPNIGCSHIPLVFSHPKLPSFDVNDSVTSVQVLPTLLDLLLETGSLSESSARAVRDLITMYEGQSMIRHIHKESTPKDVDGEQTHVDWQFTIINPGRAMVGVRDTRHKNRRLVVPVIENIEWQFTDLDKDPRMIEPVLGFEYPAFVKAVEQKYGLELAHWAEEAAFAARWWVEENNKRWHYGPYKD